MKDQDRRAAADKQPGAPLPGKACPRDQNRSEAAEGDRHPCLPTKSTLSTTPCASTVRPNGPSTMNHKKNRRQQFTAGRRATADHREEEIEHFLDRQRPENVPAARQISMPGFEKIHVKSKRGEERAGQSSPVRRDNEVFDVREIDSAQHSEQQQEQRRDTGETQQIEIARRRPGKATPQTCRSVVARRSENPRRRKISAPRTGHSRPEADTSWAEKPFRVRYFRNLQAHVDVVHQHEEDGQTTEQVDAATALPVVCGVCGLRVGAIFSKFLTHPCKTHPEKTFSSTFSIGPVLHRRNIVVLPIS